MSKFEFNTTKQKSYLMSCIKSKNTKPEKILMRALKELGIYFTKHRKDIIGKPDIVFKKKRIAVFIDSDFWHGKTHMPKVNQDYWLPKLKKNRERDIQVNKTLAEIGWIVIRFTDKEIKKNLLECLEKIIRIIH